MRQGWAWSA